MQVCILLNIHWNCINCIEWIMFSTCSPNVCFEEFYSAGSIPEIVNHDKTFRGQIWIWLLQSLRDDGEIPSNMNVPQLSIIWRKSTYHVLSPLAIVSNSTFLQAAGIYLILRPGYGVRYPSSMKGSLPSVVKRIDQILIPHNYSRLDLHLSLPSSYNLFDICALYENVGRAVF